MKFDNEILLLCDCSSCEHQLIVRFDNDSKEVYAQVHLFTYKSFWKRLWAGLKYAFGHKSTYGEFDEVILREEDADSVMRIADHLKKKTAQESEQ